MNPEIMAGLHKIYGAGPQGYQQDNPQSNNTMLDPSVGRMTPQGLNGPAQTLQRMGMGAAGPAVPAPTVTGDPNKSFMENQTFDTDMGQAEPVDLRVSTGKKATQKKPMVDESAYSLYEPIPGAKRAGQEDKPRGRLLHEQESAGADLVDTLDKMATTIKENPWETMIPGTKAYQDMAALERSVVESGRKAFGSGANFTEFEIENILKQVGPVYGLSAAKQPSAAINPEERIERLELAQSLFLNKTNKNFESNGYRPKRVQVTGPDGSIIEVDATESSRAKRLAADPKAWKEFIKGLK